MANYEMRIEAKDRKKIIEFGRNRSSWEDTYKAASLVIEKEPEQFEDGDRLVGRILTNLPYAEVVQIMVDEAGLMGKEAVAALRSRSKTSKCYGDMPPVDKACPIPAIHPEIQKALKAPRDVTELKLQLMEHDGDWIALTELSKEIGQLTELRLLDLSFHKIAALPSAIGELVRLESLSVGSSGEGRLETLPPEIGKLSRLKELNLNHNKLSRLPVEFAKLKNLRELWLSENSFSLFPSEVLSLNSLEQLYISDNPFGEVPAGISKLKSLRILALGGGGKIRNLPPEIGDLAALEEFQVDYTEITSLPPTIGKLRNLRSLKIRYGKQLASLPTDIGKLSNLEVLLLDGNGLTSLPKELGQLRKLRYLGLDGNHLTSLEFMRPRFGVRTTHITYEPTPVNDTRSTTLA